MGTGLFNSESKILEINFIFRKLELHASDIFFISEIIEKIGYKLKSLRSDYLVIKDYLRLNEYNLKNIRQGIIIEYAKEIGLEFFKNENYLIIIITSNKAVIELSKNIDESTDLAHTIFTYLKSKKRLNYPIYIIYTFIVFMFLFTLFFYPDYKINFLYFFIVMNLILIFNTFSSDYVLVPTKSEKITDIQNKNPQLIKEKIFDKYWYRQMIKILSSLIVGLIATILGGYILNKLI